jgi:hypothetical protein
LGGTFEHGALDIDSAPYGVYDTNKFEKHAVAGGLHDAAAMFGDLRVDQFLSMGLELSQRAFFIGAYQPAIV